MENALSTLSRTKPVGCHPSLLVSRGNVRLMNLDNRTGLYARKTHDLVR